MADRIRLKNEYGADQYPDSRVLISRDARTTNPAPSDCPQGVQVDFKRTDAIGFNETVVGHTYCTLITIRSYVDMSAGVPQQIAIMDNGRMYKRHATSGSAWSAWTLMNSEQEFEATFTWSAGTIGTRGGQQTFSLGWFKPSAVFVSYVLDSSTIIPVLFVHRPSENDQWILYVNGYRASAGAVNNNKVRITVRY